MYNGGMMIKNVEKTICERSNCVRVTFSGPVETDVMRITEMYIHSVGNGYSPAMIRRGKMTTGEFFTVVERSKGCE
jgi:hypothetical protein